MLTDLILQFGEEHIESFYSGYRIPEDFRLPDNILVFMHDWFTRPSRIHTRYMLIIPAVPMEYVVDNGINYLVKPGQVLFSFPCQSRRVKLASSDLKHGYPRLMITFELPEKTDYIPDNMLLELSSKAKGYLEELVLTYKEHKTAKVAVMLYLLLNELSHGETVPQPKFYSEPIRNALRYISDHQGENITLEELAKAAHCGASNLRLLFKKEIGISPGAYITDFKLKIAQNCLARSTMKIEEIAEKCGFQSIYAFSHFFKKKTGISPLAWKNSILQKQ